VGLLGEHRNQTKLNIPRAIFEQGPRSSSAKPGHPAAAELLLLCGPGITRADGVHTKIWVAQTTQGASLSRSTDNEENWVPADPIAFRPLTASDEKLI